MSDALRIAVTGITGRMGKEIIKCITEREKKFNQKIVLGAAISRLNASICGMDAGTLTKSKTLGVIITDSLESVRNDFDVLVDFTAPDISIEYLKFCVDNNKNMVIGTTGFTQIHKRFIVNASKKIGIILSSNFSIGVALILKLLRIITYIVGDTSDISILEMHHKKKRDIPSGTALTMKNVIVDALRRFTSSDNVVDNNVTFEKDSISRSFHDAISIHSIRTGDIIGEHTVLFTGSGERLEIIHKASDRVIFAYGALCSAIWLGFNKIGLFDMNHVLQTKMSFS